MDIRNAYYHLVIPYLKKYDYDSAEFAETYHYDGPLGTFYSKEKTEFYVWSPVVKNIEILFFGKWERGKEIPDKAIDIWPMEKKEKGLWHYTCPKDINLGIYLYRVTYDDGEQKVTLDPYAKAVTINSSHTVVFNPEEVQIEDLTERKSFPSIRDAIIYEASVRDLTTYPETNIKHKAKYLGMTEEGRVNKANLPVGLDYVADLGVTHIQFLPVYDFMTVDERNPQISYNWGYDPENYNVPDGSFATDPYHPLTRIIELKQMIKALHNKNLGVIMDVVYNHVYSKETHPFTTLVPGYYFRHDSKFLAANGTFCGNEIASERSMVRRYIQDSVLYWTNEYKMNGFRFDLMGILDVTTMSSIRKELDKIDPNIIILGEGWNMGAVLPFEEKAIPENSHKLKNIAFFNDQLRNAVRGDVFNDRAKGFVTGVLTDQDFLNYDFLRKRYQSPKQIVQYVEAHDNYTLFDQITRSLQNRPMDEYERRQNLATSMVLLTQGVPFIHAGQEFLRTKFGDQNSYNAPDAINQMDWSQIDKDSVAYFKALNRFRKKFNHLYYDSFDDILDKVEVAFLSENLIKVRNKTEMHDLWIYFNANESLSYTLVDAGKYRVYFADNHAYLDENKELEFLEGSNTIQISPLSTLVMEKIRKI